MSRSAVLAATALVVALFALLTSFFAVAAPDTPTRERLVAEADGRTAYGEGELLTRMIQFQRYAEKTHLAAEADNWELAAFYAHEVEENAERLVDGGHVDEGVDISAIAAEVALPRAEALHAAAAAPPRPARCARRARRGRPACRGALPARPAPRGRHGGAPASRGRRRERSRQAS